jgi:hypothetical protein
MTMETFWPGFITNSKKRKRSKRMKGLKFVIGVYCAVWLIAGCAVPLGEDYTLTRDGDPGAGITFITNYNLPDYVPIPAPGERPVNLLNRSDLDVVVVWKDEAGMDLPTTFETFLADTVYKAEIQLTANPGYAFSGTFFTYPPGKINTQIDDGGDPTRTVTVTYNNTDLAHITFITDYNLQSYIPLPMFGEKPIRMISTRADVTGGALWYVKEPNSGDFNDLFEDINDPDDFTFELGAVYRANIWLEPKTDYRFKPDGVFTYTEGITDINPMPGPEPDIRRVIVTYMPTRIPVPISDFNLTPYIPKPVNGVTPVMSFAGVQYAGTVSWKNTNTQTFLTGPFQADTAYTAELSLSPASGYTLDGIGSNIFQHTGAESVANSAGSNVVTIKFPLSPGVGSPTIVYYTTLTDYLPKPVNGVTPVMNIASEQYSGSVAWAPSHSTFQLGTPYTAVLTLKAVSGFTFTGIGQDVFSHGAAPNGVTNPSSSGTVTIYFPDARPPSSPAIRFGPADTENSALKLLKERNSDNDQVLIELPSGPEEDVPYSANLLAGDTSPTRVILDGHGRILNKTSPGSLITINGGVTLTLQNITLQGYTDNDAPLITVRAGGKLILGAGAVITGNITSSDAGGIWVDGGNLIIINGAVIKKNRARRGCGLLVSANGRVLMDKGTIGGTQNNDANSVFGVFGIGGGGGVCMDSGSFDMYGGAIQSNYAESEQSAGGVIVGGGAFDLHGGLIKDNTARNRYSGGGVAVYGDGIFTMNGAAASITGNVAQEAYSGGGLSCFNTADSGEAIFDLYAGTITHNTALGSHSGGAVYVGAWTEDFSIIQVDVRMYGGTITDNRAGALAVNSGGAVYCGFMGEFNMYGGTITDNTAEAADSGGAVSCEFDGEFSMMNGTIKDNTAWGLNSGGAVRLSSSSGFTMSGGSVKGNKALSNVSDRPSAGAVYMTGEGGCYTEGGTIGGTTLADANTALIGANAIYAAGETSLSVGGKITGNTGNNNYAVYITSTNVLHAFTIGGRGMITQNDRVFLGPGVMVFVTYLNPDPNAGPVANLFCANPIKYSVNPTSATKLLFASSAYNPNFGSNEPTTKTGRDKINEVKDFFRYGDSPVTIEAPSSPEQIYSWFYYHGYYNGAVE